MDKVFHRVYSVLRVKWFEMRILVLFIYNHKENHSKRDWRSKQAFPQVIRKKGDAVVLVFFLIRQ